MASSVWALTLDLTLVQRYYRKLRKNLSGTKKKQFFLNLRGWVHTNVTFARTEQ